ncbi:MAG: hypothetical protein ACREHF_11045 [Rhizomicrobium sp.]
MINQSSNPPCVGRLPVMTLTAAVLAVFLISCDNSTAGKTPDAVRFAHPQRDAARAIANGDFSLRGVYRIAIYVPGIQGDYEVLRKKFRIVPIAGTSDVIIKNDPNSFNNRAKRYAAEYNKRIFAALGCSVTAPMDKCTHYPR